MCVAVYNDESEEPTGTERNPLEDVRDARTRATMKYEYRRNEMIPNTCV